MFKIDVLSSGWAYPEQDHPANDVFSIWCSNIDELGVVNIHIGKKEYLLECSSYDDIERIANREWNKWLANCNL